MDGEFNLLNYLYTKCYDRYNEICLHGTIIATKFLFLGESVRDVVDLKLSSRFMAPTNILGNN